MAVHRAGKFPGEDALRRREPAQFEHSLCRIGRERIASIPNGVDLSAFDEGVDRAGLRRELGLEPDDDVVIHVGGMRPVKDHATLIRAFARTRAARPRARLLIVGGDPASGRRYYAEAISLPMYAGFGDVLQDQVIAALGDALR